MGEKQTPVLDPAADDTAALQAAYKQAHAPDQQPVAIATADPSYDTAALQAAYKQAHAQDQQPTNQTNLQGQVSTFIKPVTDYFSQHYSRGEKSVHNGLLYADVADGKLTFDQAKSQAQTETPDMTPWYDKLAPLVEASPALVEMAKNGAAGVGGGAVVGGVGGFSLGLGAGVASAPMGLAGAFAGGALGGEGMVVITGARIAQGQILQAIDAEDPEHKIPRDQAINFARTGGAIIGALQRFGVGAFGKQVLAASMKELAVKGASSAAPQVLMKVLPNVAGQSAQGFLQGGLTAVKRTLLSDFLKQYYKNAGITFTDVALQNLTATTAKTIAQMQNGVPVKDLPGQLAADLVSAFNFAAGSPIATAAVNRVGGAIGKAVAIHHTPDISDLHRSALTVNHLLAGEEIPSPSMYDMVASKADREKQQQQTFDERQKTQDEHAQNLLKAAIAAAELVNRKGETVQTEHPAQYETLSAHAQQKLRRLGAAIGSDVHKLNTMFQYIPKAERNALIAELETTKEIDSANNNADHQGELLKAEIEMAVGKPFVDIVKTLVHDAWAHGMRSKANSKAGAVSALQQHNGGLLEKFSAGVAEKLFGKFPEYLSSKVDKNGNRVPGVFKGTRAQAVWLLEAMQTARGKTSTNKSELPAMHGLDEDPKALHAALHKQGFTFEEDVPGGQSTEAVLKQVLDDGNPDSRKVMDGIKNFYRKHNLPFLSRAHERLTGKALHAEDNYFGQLYRDVPGVDGLLPYERFLDGIGAHVPRFGEGVNEKAAPKSTENRTENQYPIVLRNGYQAAQEAIFNSTSYDALGEKAKTLSVVMNNKALRKAWDLVLGHQFKRDMDTHLNDIFNMRTNRKGVFLEVLNGWMADWGHALLLLQPFRYVKHYFQLVTYMLADVGGGKQMPTADFIANTLDYYKDPATANDTLWRNSKALQNKYTSSFKQALVGGIRTSDQLAVAKNNAKEYANVFLKEGAKHADQAGMWAIRKYMLDHGATEAQAMTAAEKALKETQFTNDIGKLGNLNRESYLKIISQFKQYPTAMFVLQLDALREAANHPSKQSYINAARTIYITHMAQAMFVAVDTAYVLSTTNDQKKAGNALWRQIWEFTQGPVGPADRITSAENVKNVAMGTFKELDFPILPVEAASETMAWLSTGAKMALHGQVTPETIGDLLLHWSKGPNAFTTKLPPEPFKQAAHLIKGK